MTLPVDIANRALLTVGIQKKISSLTQDSAEAQSINLTYYSVRDDLLRMAPWNFAQKTAVLTYITSTPGTPENTSAGLTMWAPGQPPPPWVYEYQYPVDCVRPGYIIPATQGGYVIGTPAISGSSGGSANQWSGPPVPFKVMTDTFIPVVAATVASGGTGYAVGDIITLAGGIAGLPPIGAPAQLSVTGVSGGAVTAVSVVAEVTRSSPAIGGSYFAAQPNPQAQGSTTGEGSGAMFNLTYGPAAPQRVIVTNQEYALLVYNAKIEDPNIMDNLFQRAWVNLIAAHVALSLKADKTLANMLIGVANDAIMKARTADGNEGLTINNNIPDWMRIRGDYMVGAQTGAYNSVDWGGLWPSFG